ncbi:MAG TPA: helix-turn-helix domain-containing protein [Paraburkholderia sp.]|nr:helix-turn-helix domain-containing protein [Paraburkholderia sp.]
MPTFFDTDDTPVGQRFAQWREVSSRLFLPVDVASQSIETFRYTSARSAIDGIPIGNSMARDTQVKRTARHIAGSVSYPVSLYIPTCGKLGLAQAGGERSVEPGECALVDTARAYETDVRAEFCFTWMHIPRERLACRIGGLDLVAGRTFSLDNPYVRLAIDFIRNIASVADQLSGEKAHRVAEHALDLLATAIEDCMGALPSDDTVRRSAMLHHAQTYIDHHLSDAGLSLGEVAAALKVSPRYLSGLFGEAETPYRTLLRERRLERCAGDLSDPRLAFRSVTDIALSWGFVDPAHFSRTFKTRYGLSPSDYRAMKELERYPAEPTDGPPDAL